MNMTVNSKKFEIKKINLIIIIICFSTKFNIFTASPINPTFVAPIMNPPVSFPPGAQIFMFNISSNNVEQAAKQVAEITNSVTQKQIQDQLQTQNGNWDKLYNTGLLSWNFIKNHKLATSICIAGTLYIYSLYKLNQLEQALERTESLSHWKADCNLDELLATDNIKLVQDLDQLIKSHYETFFKSEIERELTVANSYLRFYQQIKFWHLTRFYPNHESKIKTIEIKISRLNYLKSLFNSWQNSKITA